MQLANTSEYCAEKLDGGKPCQKACGERVVGHCVLPVHLRQVGRSLLTQVIVCCFKEVGFQNSIG